MVFSRVCSDSTFAGHHLLCPLLTTVLAKSRSQTERASAPKSRPPPRQAWKEAGTQRAWLEGLQKLRLFILLLIYAVIDEDEDDD